MKILVASSTNPNDSKGCQNIDVAEDQTNKTKRCAILPPFSGDFLEHITLTEKIFFFVCLAATAFVFIEFISKVKFVLKSYETAQWIKWKTLQILGIYPAIALITVFALFVPRADLVCDVMVSVYLSKSMFNFVSLMEMYFGGVEKIKHTLRDRRINFRQSPCCCCCFCFPTAPVNRKSVRIVKCLVLQGAILLPLISTTTLFMWIDGRYHNGKIKVNNTFPYLQSMTVASSLVSIWGFHIFYDLCKESLRPLLIVQKFALLKATIVLTQLQKIVVVILVGNGIPACDEWVPTYVRGSTFYQIILILEMTLLSLIARKLYLQPQTNQEVFFDGKTSEGHHVDTEKALSLEKDEEVFDDFIDGTLNGFKQIRETDL